jgi:hypothetical protein
MKLRSYICASLMALPLVAAAQQGPGLDWSQRADKPVVWSHRGDSPVIHSFFDRSNLKIQTINVVSQTMALMAIQSHDNGGGMAPCVHVSTCTGALAARGRTLDPLEKHFESYGYGWGAAYRYGGGVGLNLLVAYMFHASGHHKLEQWAQVVSIAHAQASTGYALTGSSQGKNGW